MWNNVTPPQSSAVAGIHDAQLFSIGNGAVDHTPHRYPNGVTVVAKCGAVGYVAEHDGFREATWRSGYDSRPACDTCNR